MKPKNIKTTLFRLLTFLKPYRITLLIVTLAALLSTLFQLVAPLLISQIVNELFNGVVQGIKDGIISGIDVDFIMKMIIMLVLLYVFSSLFSYVQQVLAGRIAQRAIYDLRSRLNEKLANLPLKFYDSRSHGDVLSRAVNDVDNVGNTLQQVISQLLSSLITIIGVLIMMFMLSPLITLIILITLPLSYWGIKAVTKRSMPHFMSVQRTLGELNGHVEETYTGHAIAKAYGMERNNIHKFREINEQMYMSGKKAQFISGLMIPLISIINNLSFILICIFGGLLVMRGTMTVGSVQAFIQYARTFSQPLTQMASITNVIQSGIAAAERIFEILDAPDEIPDADRPAAIAKVRGEVKFEKVHFQYKEEVPLIDNMNIEIKQGQTVAIVGPTGAGKSTIINLLLRFYELDGGRITIDGVNIANLRRKDLRSMFGMVLQDAWLFSGTIQQNIAYGKPNATEEEIVQAAIAANADHFIHKLADGYQTMLDEDGDMLSHGQKQLITIARALLADPVILILDEATSNVDTRTEANIQQAMRQLMNGRTSFVIAHRLSTIRDADLILVMDKGRIIEHGNHNALLERNGFYAELYYSQFQDVGNEVG